MTEYIQNKNELCIKIKNNIGQLSSNELEEVFKIIYNSNNNYSKNNNGVFINLTWINDEILIKIDNYIDFCIKSHNEINKYENICNNFSDAINSINKDKTEIENTSNINELKNKQKVSSYMKFYLLKKKFAKQSLISNNKNEKHLTHEEYLL